MILRKYKEYILLILILALSTFTHLWNAVGFPDQAPDDGTYIRRALRVIEGLGPQQDTFYDHPYFGQIFLGTVFIVIGYPDITVPSMPASMQDLQHSVEMLYTIPRILMAILAVVDTFLIYKIAEWRYNRNVAFIAAILFAVMPYTWLIRRALIEPIQLPFLLTAILFALYSGLNARQKSKLKEIKKVKSREENEEIKVRERERERESQGKDCNNYSDYKKAFNQKNIILLLSSGIFLGLTIFTKIPAVTLIPLVGFIVFTNNKKSFKALGIWIIPVILIALIWPLHAVLAGEYNQLLEGINYQTSRTSKPLLDAVNDFYNKDPVLLILGIAGFAYAAVVKKDFIFIIWATPFLAFFYLLDYVSHFHMIPLIPAFCIGAAVLIQDLSDKLMHNKKLVRKILPFAIISAIGIFGLVSTTSLIAKVRTSSDFDVLASVAQHLPEDAEIVRIASNSHGSELESDDTKSSKNEHLTIIGTSKHFWIFQYVFDKLEYVAPIPVAPIPASIACAAHCDSAAAPRTSNCYSAAAIGSATAPIAASASASFGILRD